MKKCGNWPISVCSWSLQTGVDGVVDAMKQLDIDHVHLAIGPALDEGSGDAYVEAIKAQDWTISSTMIDYPQEDYSTLETIKVTGGIMPNDCWHDNMERSLRAVKLTADLGSRFLSMHAGFLDHTDLEREQIFHDRVRCIADASAEQGITLLLETGQETAGDLKWFLEKQDHPALGVNFDPANIILYGKGVPAEAVKELAPWIKHVHIKDAKASQTPGEWGAEVPWGDGEVGGKAFLDILASTGFNGCVAVEREAGDQRMEDIKLAVERLTA